MDFRIPLIKPTVGEEELAAVKRVFESGILTQGEETEAFEKEFAEFVGSKYAIATTSCTIALYLALKSVGVGLNGLEPDDEVIVPDFTFPASANAVYACGAKPVLCDIRLEEFQIDPDKIEELITPKTVAIMPVDEFGLTADMKPIMEIADEHGLWVIEDAAPAIGSKRYGRHAGTFGHIGCFSFHPRKLCAIGEGGMIITDDESVADTIRTYRNHGLHNGQFLGNALNFRLSNVQAAIGRVQLQKLPLNILNRRSVAEGYGVLADNGFEIPVVPKHCFHTYQSYVIRTKHATTIRSKMREKGIEVQIGTYALHTLPAFENTVQGSTLKSYLAYTTGLALPLYSTMGWQDQMEVIEELLEELGKFE